MPVWFAVTLCASAPARAEQGEVVAAVVYPDRAQVTRARSVECGSGRATVVFEGIPPAVDAQSFRAVATGGTVEGLRFEERTRSDAFGPEYRDMEGKVRKAEEELSVLEDASKRSEGVAELAKRYGTLAATLVAREMIDSKPDVKEWGNALDSSREAQLKASAELAASEEKIRELRKSLTDLRVRLAHAAAAGKRKEYVVEAMVSCSSGTTRVELTYLVGGAAWSPSYEARLDNRGAVELATFGTIVQSTGENWTNARITLSTAVPGQNATPPIIGKLKVSAAKREPPRKVLVSRSELQQHAATPAGAATAGGARLTVADQGISVQMIVPRPGDVTGDGTPTRLLVAHSKLPGEVHLRSAPKFVPFVFRVTDLINAAPFPLLPGPVDSFRNGDFIGRSGLTRVAVGERFTLTFGVSESIQVQRYIVEEARLEKGVFGTDFHHMYEYRLIVGNWTQRSEEIEITEQVPVSELDDVKVVVDSNTTAGYTHDKVDGIVKWRLKIPSGEKRDLRLSFRVEAPASYQQ